MSSDIFISYAREDLDWVKMLAKVLEENGWSVWWDREIAAGQVFSDVIETALKEAKCLVVVWSRHSIESRWVREEAEEGAKREILVPVMKEDVTIPFGYRQFHAGSLVNWDGSQTAPAFRQLLKDITGITGVPLIPSPPPRKETSTAPKKKKQNTVKETKAKTPGASAQTKKATETAEKKKQFSASTPTPNREKQKTKPVQEVTPMKRFESAALSAFGLAFLIGLGPGGILRSCSGTETAGTPVMIIGGIIGAIIGWRMGWKHPKD